MTFDAKRLRTGAVIGLRRWMRRRRRSAWLCLSMGAILAALVWTHAGGEAMAMADEHPGEVAMAICLAILDATLVGVGVGSRSFTRRFELSISCKPDAGPHLRQRRPLQRPPPRAGPRLQVFLR